MKLTIIAATGGVGRHLLRQALDAGHDVTAVARNPARLSGDALAGRIARIVAADLADPDPQVLGSAVAGADAVLSALGPHNNSDAGVAAPGTRAITTAMAATGVRRIVAISASPVGTEASPGRPDPPRHDPGDGFFMRHVGRRRSRASPDRVYTGGIFSSRPGTAEPPGQSSGHDGAAGMGFGAGARGSGRAGVPG